MKLMYVRSLQIEEKFANTALSEVKETRVQKFEFEQI